MANEDPTGGSFSVKDYDRKAEACNWRGPEVAFGLAYAFVHTGQSVLDIGIGTGLGSVLFRKAGLHVYGMDASPEMLDVCRAKGFAADLRCHDLTVEPYPYETASIDHAVCMGVLHFFGDLRCVFRQVSRVLRDDGVFVFIVEDRGPGEAAQYVLGPEYTESDSFVTMYRHGMEEIGRLLDEHGFAPARSLEFPVPMNPEGTAVFRAKAYVGVRAGRG
ncbi:MAG: class I SAM-dependent methyltransferase [Phycisphaerae bacterium]|nr:class I SAM-dependent methyltransferase [Phycisphaerae bacterium]